jgi:hypothetical protein
MILYPWIGDDPQEFSISTNNRKENHEQEPEKPLTSRTGYVVL